MSIYANSIRTLVTRTKSNHGFKIGFVAVLCVVGAALLAFQPTTARAQSTSSSAPALNLKQALAEMSIGSSNAPLTLYEYSSLTCPHCASFHAETLPLIEKNYVKTGKVRVVFKDFPLDGLATGALMIVRCSAPQRRVDFFGMLYNTQDEWVHSKNPMASIIALARFFGMQKSEVNTCLSNQPLLAAIQTNTKTAVNRYGLDSTPSFVLNDKVVAKGALSYGEFATILDKALAAKNIKNGTR